MNGTICIRLTARNGRELGSVLLDNLKGLATIHQYSDYDIRAIFGALKEEKKAGGKQFLFRRNVFCILKQVRKNRIDLQENCWC
jgi:hypothetical protein